MSKVIVYVSGGSVCVIVPSDENDIDFIAKKDVPFGLPYKIMDSGDLPDRSFRGAWEVDVSILTDGVGDDFGAGSTNAVVGYDNDGVIIIAPITPIGSVDYTQQKEAQV